MPFVAKPSKILWEYGKDTSEPSKKNVFIDILYECEGNPLKKLDKPNPTNIYRLMKETVAVLALQQKENKKIIDIIPENMLYNKEIKILTMINKGYNKKEFDSIKGTYLEDDLFGWGFAFLSFFLTQSKEEQLKEIIGKKLEEEYYKLLNEVFGEIEKTYSEEQNIFMPIIIELQKDALNYNQKKFPTAISILKRMALFEDEQGLMLPKAKLLIEKILGYSLDFHCENINRANKFICRYEEKVPAGAPSYEILEKEIPIVMKQLSKSLHLLYYDSCLYPPIHLSKESIKYDNNTKKIVLRANLKKEQDKIIKNVLQNVGISSIDSEFRPPGIQGNDARIDEKECVFVYGEIGLYLLSSAKKHLRLQLENSKKEEDYNSSLEQNLKQLEDIYKEDPAKENSILFKVIGQSLQYQHDKRPTFGGIIMEFEKNDIKIALQEHCTQMLKCINEKFAKKIVRSITKILSDVCRIAKVINKKTQDAANKMKDMESQIKSLEKIQKELEEKKDKQVIDKDHKDWVKITNPNLNGSYSEKPPNIKEEEGKEQNSECKVLPNEYEEKGNKKKGKLSENNKILSQIYINTTIFEKKKDSNQPIENRKIERVSLTLKEEQSKKRFDEDLSTKIKNLEEKYRNSTKYGEELKISFEKQNENIKQLKEEKKLLIQENENLKSNIKGKEESSNKNDMKKLLTTFSENIQRSYDLQSKSILKIYETIDEKNIGIQNLAQGISKIKNKIKELEEELTQVKNKYTRMKERNKEKKKKIKDLNQNIKELNEKIKEFEKKNEALEEKINSLQADKDAQSNKQSVPSKEKLKEERKPQMDLNKSYQGSISRKQSISPQPPKKIENSSMSSPKPDLKVGEVIVNPYFELIALNSKKFAHYQDNYPYIRNYIGISVHL